MSAATTAETFAPATFHSNAATNHSALVATHWWDSCMMSISGDERHAALAPLAAAYYSGGATAVIKAASGSNSGYRRRGWALAMTAVHGPTGMHESQEQHPDILAAKSKAEASLRAYLSM